MRKTTEELWKQALAEQTVDSDVPETFRRLAIENERVERIEELSFDAAMANQAREIGNHFGLTYMQVWSDTSIASQVIDKMKEQQATIAQQAKRIKELETKLTLFVSRG